MASGFLDEMKRVPDHRVAGMVTFPLDEILLATLVAVVCGADDWERVEDYASESLDWLRRDPPFAEGIPTAQTFRKVFRALDPDALERGFASWAGSLRVRLGGETSRRRARTHRHRRQDRCAAPSKAADGAGALHLVSAYASDAGLVLAQRAVADKSNEITAIPAVLALLALDGAIVSIDAIGTQKHIAAAILDKRGDYVLALKANQTSLHEDARLFFADSVLVANCTTHAETACGHGRIEERSCRAASADWLAERHPDWKGLRSIAAITARRIDKKTGAESLETRFYISSLAPDPALLFGLRARALEHREQSPLGARRRLRRRPLPHPQGQFRPRTGADAQGGLEPAQTRAHPALHPPKTRKSLHEPRFPSQNPRRLTIQDFALPPPPAGWTRRKRILYQPSMEIREALTFDDVLLEPGASEVLPADVNTATRLTRGISLNIPLISAAMDTVTEARLAIAMAQAGGLGVIHRNMTPAEQADQVKMVKKFESGMVIDPITIHPDQTVGEIILIKEARRISGFPVVDRDTGKLVGILTNRDMRFAEMNERVADLMTKDNLVTVREGVNEGEAKRLLHKHRIERVIVVDDANRVTGLITVKDFEKAQAFPIAPRTSGAACCVGAASTIGDAGYERSLALIEAGVDVVVIDTAHGHSKVGARRGDRIKRASNRTQIIAGNVATADGAKALIDAGADAVKVGIGPGSICTTRIVAGVGVPQLTAVMDAARRRTRPTCR